MPENDEAIAFVKAMEQGRMSEEMASRYIYIGKDKKTGEDMFVELETGNKLD